MSNKVVQNWFQGEFLELAPELQALHLNGGKLEGDVTIVLGKGVAGFIGKRLATKLNLPSPGVNKLEVNISHHDDGLHWDRLFNNQLNMSSVFEPVGTKANGYWLERTGPLHMHLTVDIKDHGWYWRCLRFRFFGVPLPVWMFPESQAYKRIEDGAYRFYVGFNIPLIGHLLSYEGRLHLKA